MMTWRGRGWSVTLTGQQQRSRRNVKRKKERGWERVRERGRRGKVPKGNRWMLESGKGRGLVGSLFFVVLYCCKSDRLSTFFVGCGVETLMLELE